MNDGLKQAYVDRMSAQLKELAAKVEGVKARVAQGAANVRIEYHTQIEDWSKMEDAFKKKLEEVGTSTAETFESAKNSVQTAWADVSKYVVDNFEKVERNLKK